MKPLVSDEATVEKPYKDAPPAGEEKKEKQLVNHKNKTNGGVFKTAVFRIVEKNELESYNSAGQRRGYADIESVDGAFRFKIGVIDFLTKYSHLKFIENQTKAAINQVDSLHVSAIDQESYKTRFVQFMKDNL